ncbi:MAG TPA: S8 family serine peptidase [Gaiellaceae bacterium]|nr:S8 family serine peptidase [Gaiellaceae bacterium]
MGVFANRNDFRFRAWHVGLLALVFALALGMIRPGVSWGSSVYSPGSDPYSLQNVTAADGVQAWWNAGVTGKGVDVALIDTGVSPVPALRASGKIVNGPDLSLESQDPSFQHLDTNGHGTFMAGIVGGNDGQPGGYRGVAPDSRILSVKVGDANGGVDVSQVIAAVDWVVQHRYDHGLNIRVINLSYGTNSTQPYMLDPLAYAVEQAWKAGIVVVTAAGNTGIGSGLADPAYDPSLISVGASDTNGTASTADDRPAQFTAGAATCVPGNCVEPTLLAPGVHMQGVRVPGSYVDQNNPSAVLGSLYFRGSGTSEAAAYVTGAVALLLQKYPKLTPDQVKQLVISGAQTLPGVSPLVQGHGELDLSKLLPAGGGPGHAPGPALPATPPGHGSGPVWSSGRGSLGLSRGDDLLSMNGIVLQGDKDIFGKLFNAKTMAALEASGHSWSGGTWNGSSWSGSSWSGSSWSGSSWSGSSWSGSSWSSLTWAGNSWSGSSWSGSSWSGSSWSGNSWSASSFSGGNWSGSSWSGAQWLGASWG